MSSPSSYSDTITNIFFGLCALAVGIITVWQARKHYRMRRATESGTALQEGQAGLTGNHDLELITVDHNPQEAAEAPVNIEDGPLPATTPSNTEDPSPRASFAAATASSRLWHDDPVSETKPTDGSALSDTDHGSLPLLDLPSPSGAHPVVDDNGRGKSEAAST
ncbi:MAG: hypothetical protein Q9195_004384 [Heterodermia aff. obscurata]